MPFGYIDTRNIDFAVGQSESKLRNMQNRLGIGFDEMIQMVDGAVTAVNQISDPLIQGLIYRTNEDRVVGGDVSDKVLQRGGEYDIPRPQRSSGGAWLLPLYDNGISLGFTKKSLETITLDTFERELRTTVQAIQRGQRADVLEALFSLAERPLDDDGTGATPGFIGSGAGTNVYQGPVPPGETLGVYTQYLRLAATGLEAAVKTAFDKFAWFHPGAVFDLVGPSSSISTIAAFDEFVASGSALVRPGQGTAEALVDPARYEGVLFGRIRVWSAEAQLGGTTFAIYRSAGANSSGNPLAWRYSDIWGADAWVEDRELYPLANAVVKQNYGVGVNRRESALLIHVDSAGNYEPPTISR